MNDDHRGVETDAALPSRAAVAPKQASLDVHPDTVSEDAAREPDSFADLLFGHAPAEDLAGLSPGSREELAQAARAHLADARPSGTPSIRLVDREVDRDGRRRDLSLLEVVNDDRPFLLASTLAELAERRLSPRLVAHPILDVERDEAGALVAILGEIGGPPSSGISRESLIHIHLDRIDDALERDGIVRSLEAVYRDVAAVADDAGPMRAQLAALTAEYRDNPPPLALDEVVEAVALLDWLADDTFTLLGMRASRLPADEGAPEPVEGSSLGLLRDPGMHVLKRGTELVAVTPEIRAFLERPTALIITKASVKSRVGPRDYLDYIGVKLFSPSGRLWGELSIVGRFTPRAYTQPVVSVPYVRRKVEGVIRRAGFDPDSFAGRALIDVLETYPRDEIVQIDEEQLFRFALDLERLSEHPRIRVLSRIDRFDRFVSVIVYMPKDRYDAAVRRATGDLLARLYGGRVSAAYPAYPPGTLTRTHFIIGRDGTPTPEISREMLESGVAALARTWADRLAEAFADRIGGPRSRLLAQRYGEAFGAAYRENFDATQALVDIGHLERLSDATPRAVDLYRRDGDDAARVNLKLFSRGASLPLSDRVPLLERLGFRVVNERTYRVAPVGTADSARTWLHDMALERASGAPVDIAELDSRMEAALLAVLGGVAESDGFNKLVLEARLGWRDAALIRALGRYLRQIRIPYGQDYIADVLARHGAIVAEIVALFYARFDPHLAEPEDRAQASRDRLAAMLRDVVSLDDDRILRRFINLVEAASRTNYFQLGQNGLPPETVAFKFDCAKIEVMPQPRPSFEIFMNGPRVEALHLRFGKVARGGLRWSDRPEDFRTEVLGLVKAQQVKNAVIVPVGAKGGFVPKRLPSPTDRQAWLAEGVESYKTFVRTLLDLTDNIVSGAVIHPADTVLHDGDDSYLVVAADKGTATFSDTANAISLEEGHWLGDAFASGGSNGYDHKAMGITARGAWEAVKRHFREIDIDVERDPVTAVGVGDMSGDVFGNGMLLSRSLKLVAAFDHRDIFIDPNPDPDRTFEERRRLFALPRSSWADYDPALISPGGGVHSRALKEIALSPEAQAALGFERERATPAEIMSAILKAPVGLLFFGGIGTYVRATSETDDQAGDRANDAVRISGAEIRAKVVGEGANLGMTQRGRIEAARQGVRLNTDAIDNSAGVNTSDVEVNIKIALALPASDGRLGPEARTALLRGMTDEVSGLVLRNNVLQTLALSLAERRGSADLGYLGRLMTTLEGRGRLDRAIEFLPTDAELAALAKAGRGLTRPELAVLLAYSKLALHDELLESNVPDDIYLGRELVRYFPAALRERFPDAIAQHRLRREIIATQLANAIVNRGGPAIVVRLADETGADAPALARAYAATRDAFGLSDLYADIDALGGSVPGALQLDLYARVQDLTASRIVWFIRNVDLAGSGLDEAVHLYGDGIAEVLTVLDRVLAPQARVDRDARRAEFIAAGVPDALASRLSTLPDIVAAPDIVLVARRTGRPIADVAATHFAVEGLFRLGALAGAAGAIPVPDHYDRLARDRAVDALAAAHRRLTGEVVREDAAAGTDALAAWVRLRGGNVTRIRAAVEAIASSGLTVSKLTVAASLLGDLAKE